MIQLPQSKFAQQGPSIFSRMTAMAQRLNALNLSQGFPDFDVPPELLDALVDATRNGLHQYAPAEGIGLLREQLAQLFAKRDQIQLDPFSEITITSGATMALFATIQAVVRAGDEVIIFDPSYDSYAPSVALAGGQAIHIPLLPPHFAVDWERVKACINGKTKLIIVNTPHNPSGTLWQAHDWKQLLELIRDTPILVLSDEVYEHLVFDGARHCSALSFPELRERSVVVGSFGKTFHVTGWKTGYCVAPPMLMQRFRQVYQFASFCGVTPIQSALAHYLQHHPEHIENLSSFYQSKRDIFTDGLAHSRFCFVPSQGTYFQNLDYRQIRPDLNDVEFCQQLAEQHGIVGIPVSVFYQNPPENLRLVRFCFAKKEETLHQAVEILQNI